MNVISDCNEVPYLRLVRDKCDYAQGLDEKVTAYLNGKLARAERDRLEQHLRTGCPDCYAIWCTVGERVLGVPIARQPQRAGASAQSTHEDEQEADFGPRFGLPIIAA